MGLPTVYAFVIAFLGGLTFTVLTLPLPWLLGPIFACLGAALLGVPMQNIRWLNNTMRTILGVAVGASITPALFSTFGTIWPTLVMIPVLVFVIGLVGIPYFYRLWGYDWATSYYSAMPGGLQDMLVFGEEAGGNVRAMSLIQATRVLVIVVVLPFVLKAYWDADLSNPPGEPAQNLPMGQMILMLVCGIVGWRVAKWAGLLGASILGPLIFAGAASLAGLLEHRPPVEAIFVAQYFIGLTVGVKYAGITMRELRHDVLAGLGYCGLLIGITLAFTGVIFGLDLAPPMPALLAFAPGGQAEMAVLALIVGTDVAFVVAHHVLRIVTVILGAPLFATLFKRLLRDTS